MKTTTTQYPHLTELLQVLGTDNDMQLRKNFKWPDLDCIDKLEEQASKLDEDEKELMAAGERTEVEKLVCKHKIYLLDAFLNNAFDGPLSSTFYEA